VCLLRPREASWNLIPPLWTLGVSERMLDRIQESAWGKLHADYCWNVIEWQGNLLVWKIRRHYPRPCSGKERGTVRGFSRSSRLNLFKSFARINIGENMPYLFMTLTYPDEVRLKDRGLDERKAADMPEENFKDLGYLHMNSHRWVMWRYLEKYLEKQLPGIWRIEYKRRLTGVFKGKPMPHLHILVMTCDYIPWQEVRWFWQQTIGERFVNVDIRAIYDPELALTYLAKYVGKEPDSTLENDAYLNSIPPGRCWGYMRKNLIKKEDKWTGRYFETDDLASLRHYALPNAGELIEQGCGSFTLIGERAREVGEILVTMPIANRSVPE